MTHDDAIMLDECTLVDCRSIGEKLSSGTSI